MPDEGNRPAKMARLERRLEAIEAKQGQEALEAARTQVRALAASGAPRDALVAGLALAVRHVAKCENKSHVAKEMPHAFATVAKRIFLMITKFGGNVSRH